MLSKWTKADVAAQHAAFIALDAETLEALFAIALGNGDIDQACAIEWAARARYYTDASFKRAAEKMHAARHLKRPFKKPPKEHP